MSNPFTETITLYNHSIENRVDKWRRTVIRGVQWTGRRVNSFGATGQSVFQTEISLTIPIDADTGGKAYVDSKTYDVALDKSDKWTLNPADGDDVVVYGECFSEITDSFTVDDLAKEQTMVTIMAVADNTKRRFGKTWKVSAV